MRNLKRFIFGNILMISFFCVNVLADGEKTVALPKDIQTRKLIVNLVVIAVGFFSYYLTRFFMYHVGDVRANIENYMQRKGYGKSNSNRDRYKKMNYDMQRMREQMQRAQNHSNEEMQRQMEEMQRQMEEMQRHQNEWAMEEARKAATPFDHGGYMQGDGFNPSDTMAADTQRQMDNMNNMNNMGMF